MKSYLDSGIFVDYFVHQGMLDPSFRSASRRGRSPLRLGEDATVCLKTLALRGAAMTSTLTVYELEEAAYRSLRPTMRGVANRDRTLVGLARASASLAMSTAGTFSVEMLDLTSNIMTAVSKNELLQSRGIRAADAIHVITALEANADLLITADGTMLDLDGVFGSLRCVDTDEALRLLA